MTKGKKDSRNQLNNLTGKEWLLLTKSFWLSEKCADDKDAFGHPAPFLIKDIMKLISFFTKEGMSVLDPFCGSGTSIIAANNLNRFAYGIDLNDNFRILAEERLKKKGYKPTTHYKYYIGDALTTIKKVKSIDYIVTSPPYHNILRNKGAGIRKKNDKGFRNGSRIGVEYYSEHDNDLGNFETYQEFISALGKIMLECFKILNPKKYCSIVISDFTVEKKEICVQADIVKLMQNCGFEFCGTIILLQDNKPLYPFGYPYAYKINHQHQNIINFRKV